MLPARVALDAAKTQLRTLLVFGRHLLVESRAGEAACAGEIRDVGSVGSRDEQIVLKAHVMIDHVGGNLALEVSPQTDGLVSSAMTTGEDLSPSI